MALHEIDITRREENYLVYEGYSVINCDKANLLALKGRMSSDPQAGAVLRHEFPKSARLVLRFLHDILRGRLHALRWLLHLHLVILGRGTKRRTL